MRYTRFINNYYYLNLNFNVSFFFFWIEFESMVIALYHHTKTPVNFWCRRFSNPCPCMRTRYFTGLRSVDYLLTSSI